MGLINRFDSIVNKSYAFILLSYLSYHCIACHCIVLYFDVITRITGGDHVSRGLQLSGCQGSDSTIPSATGLLQGNVAQLFT